MRILLLAGHSQKDGGADNETFDIQEWALNETLVAIIMANMQGTKHKLFTFDRQTYSGLPADCNALNPDIILEFHHNASGNVEAKGNEVLYWNTSRNGKALATRINKVLFDTLDIRDRGIKPIKNGDRGATLLRETKAPAIIVESAFMSNKEDFANFLLKINELGKAIAKELESME